MTHVIVIGNEKGGSGKSTTAMHLIVSLLKSGFPVGAIDLDLRQRTLSRYLENRAEFAQKTPRKILQPEVRVVAPSRADSRSESKEAETERFSRELGSLGHCAYVVIDCPGADTHLSRLAHAHADTILTPMNDSFIDYDLLARVDPKSGEVTGPSLYSELVWEARKRRAMSGVPGGIDWIVMRNRLSSTNARNKIRVGEKLASLSQRIGFRLAKGLGERVIYRELFPMGLTLLDLGGRGSPVRLTVSHVAAKQELRAMLAELRLPGFEAKKAA